MCGVRTPVAGVAIAIAIAIVYMVEWRHPACSRKNCWHQCRLAATEATAAAAGDECMPLFDVFFRAGKSMRDACTEGNDAAEMVVRRCHGHPDFPFE